MKARLAFSRMNQGRKVCYSLVRHNLLWITVFVTERCNSKCRTCGIWRKKNPVDISLKLIEDIINDTTKKTYINITGGEAIYILKLTKFYSYYMTRTDLTHCFQMEFWQISSSKLAENLM